MKLFLSFAVAFANTENYYLGFLFFAEFSSKKENLSGLYAHL